jgi:type IV pilus assembly protein PilA
MKTVKCSQCNLVNFSTAISCKRCGYLFQELEIAEPVAPLENSAPLPSFPAFNQPAPPMPSQTANFQRPTFQPANYQPNYQSYQSPKFVKKGMAIFSMILGIFSFPLINTIIGVILSMIGAALFGVGGAIAGFGNALLFLPTGLITGIVALVRANKRPNEYGGKGFAIAGIVLSGLAILIIPLIAAIAIPNLLAARRSANEGSAIASLKKIANAQVNFAATKYRCGELTELSQGGLIDAELAKGTKNGYVFAIARTVSGCELLAKPTVAEGVSATGSRSFYFSTEEGLLRQSTDVKKFADRQSTPGSVDGFPPAYTFASPRLNSPNTPLPLVIPETEKIDYTNK